MGNPLEALSLAQLRARTSAKWRRFPADVLPLWVAEMDVPLAPGIVEAVTGAMAAGDTGYPSGSEYAQALRDFAAARWGWSFDAAATAPVADVMHGAAELLTMLTDPGGAIVVNSPVYHPFYRYIDHIGRRAIEAPLGPRGRIDLDALERALARAAAGGRCVLLLCSPHNPTGTVHTRAELEAAAQLAAAHGARIVVDEIHAPIVLDGAAHVPFLSLEAGARSFALMSASKGWNLAGLKAALAIAGPDAAEDLARLPEVARHGASHLGVIAHVAALRHGAPWLDELLAGLRRNRALLAELLAGQLPAVGFLAPQGTYLAWLDCRALGLGEDPSAFFLEHARVALNPGPAFGSGGEGHVRLNFATTPEILREAVARMAAALASRARA